MYKDFPESLSQAMLVGVMLVGRLGVHWRLNARKREVKPLIASQGLSEMFPCTGYKACYSKGKAPRENRVASIGI